MSANWTKWGWGLIVLGAATLAGWEIFADRLQATDEPEKKPAVAVETLLPAETVIYASHEGQKQHAAQWRQTAAHEALTAANVDELFDKLVTFLKTQAPGTFNPRVEAFANHLADQGGTLAISVPQGIPLPRATLVIHHAAEYLELVSEITTVLAEQNIASETKEIEGRQVRIARILKNPGIDLAWWAEGGHLVIAAGVDPVQNTLAVASGKKENITAHRLWKKPTPDGSQVVTSRAWVDALTLRNRFGEFPIPIPEGKPVQVKDALRVLGLDNVQELVMEAGYEGKALWSETRLNLEGERKGLLKTLEGEEISFDDLPPLPPKTTSFLAMSIEPSGVYETARQAIRESFAYGPEDAAKEFERQIDTIPNFLGFDPKADFLDALGNLVVVCDDPDQGFFGTGGTLIVKVKDAEKLRQFFEKVVNKLNNIPEVREEIARIHKTKKHGREIWHFEFGQVFQGFGVGITDDWLVMAFVPQPVEAFYLRQDGKLPKWSKERLKEAGAPVVPEKFTMLGVSSPRVIYQSLLKVAPYGFSALVVGLKEERALPRNAVLPWTLADLPPAELIAGPLFPNIRTMDLEERGIRWTSRSSLPSLPIVGGPGSGSGPVAGPAIAALVLPAIQQSRVAALRSQSKNNLKQLGLAMHNYHDTRQAFPAGTLPSEKLKPEERLSFLVELLPYVDQQPIYQKIDREAAWNDTENQKVMETRILTFVNPGVKAAMPAEYGPAHYVGLAGVGKDAPLLPITSNRAGVFGYNRKTRIQDITDGTSNTVMISEGSKDFGAWGEGGNATIRSLTKKPYINGPDGIGGPFPGGCHMLMGDGSVRFVSQAIDANTMEALTTIHGGEVVGNF